MAGLSFTGRENLRGGLGRDDFVFGEGAGVSGPIYAGAGTDAHNCQAYITGVSLNRATGAATGTGGTANPELGNGLIAKQWGG